MLQSEYVVSLLKEIFIYSDSFLFVVLVSNLFLGWEVSTFLRPVKSVGRQFYAVVFGQLLRDHPKHHLGCVNFNFVVFQFRKARTCSVTCKHGLGKRKSCIWNQFSMFLKRSFKIPRYYFDFQDLLFCSEATVKVEGFINVIITSFFGIQREIWT